MSPDIPYTLYFTGLPQNYKTTYGPGNNKKAFGQQLLLVRQRMYTGFQHNVHELLRLQQTWGGCGCNGTNIREGNNI